MGTCRHCGGSGDCYFCHGAKSVKEINPHPDPWDVDDDGEVECPVCEGSGDCDQCGGSGDSDDDD